MRIYISQEGETLITIAKKYNFDPSALIPLNPHIPNPYVQIAGQTVNFPSGPAINIPICPLPISEIVVPWTPLEQMEKTDYDVVVVGTGAGGGAAIWRLAQQWGRNGKRIGVIEAGDYILPTHQRNLPQWAPVTGNLLPPNPLYWEQFQVYPSDRPTSYPPLPPSFNQFFAFGGRSIKWSMVSPRISPASLADFPVSPKEMNRYYNIAEEVMNVNQTFYRTAPFLLNRLRENGFSEAIVTPVAVDTDPTAYGEIHSNPNFSSILLLAGAASQRPFDIAIRSRAVQVYTEKGKAVGLRVMSRDKKSYFLKTKAVVLATSTFETPRILLNSGIRGEAIGHYLTDHSYLFTMAHISPEDYEQLPGQYFILIPDAVGRPYQIQMRGFPPLGRDFDILGFGKVESRFENRVDLDPLRRDEYGMPEPVAYFSYSDMDMEVIRQTESGMKQAAAAMKANMDPICLKLPGQAMHDMGTCRIGYDASTSGANPYGQIHGINGLYVASSSMLPAIGAANPFLSIAALSIRMADYLIQHMK